jgi:hypothetical protein
MSCLDGNYIKANDAICKEDAIFYSGFLLPAS